MMNWIWFIVGMMVSVVLGLMQWWTVHRLQPDAGLAVAGWTMAGVVGRLLVMAVLLILAFSDNMMAGLLAFAGWWVGRWPLLIRWSK